MSTNIFDQGHKISQQNVFFLERKKKNIKHQIMTQDHQSQCVQQQNVHHHHQRLMQLLLVNKYLPGFA
jgi:hypothetical protein